MQLLSILLDTYVRILQTIKQIESTPEDIVQSLPYIRAIIEAFQIPILELMGYEADDIIGLLQKELKKKTLRFIWLPLIKIMGNWFLTIFYV